MPNEPTSMQLCLVNNDPTSTLLITPDGDPLYAIETPALPQHSTSACESTSSLPSSTMATPGAGASTSTSSLPAVLSHYTTRPLSRSPGPMTPPKGMSTSPLNLPTTPGTGTGLSVPVTPAKPITTIRRLEKWRASTGHVETEIGVVQDEGGGIGTRLQLCASNHQLHIGPLGGEGDGARGRSSSGSSGGSDEEKNGGAVWKGEGVEVEYYENSWEFTGPDSQKYKWQMFVHSPILILNSSTNPLVLARYRRAKIGIVSRSRRAFLEILPAGLGIIDLIVVTFVSFMRQRVAGGMAQPVEAGWQQHGVESAVQLRGGEV
ncbi:hypothetical protein BDQ12DRAFT_726004 [Crucibulum laeve]|uniref:DUF6593 domain-containing protein n=1 Tax=Crucibulum laeve TaxID=68775 RepID=A0A5C3LRG2_9AGAR|nr:hypothetical protein BDQ12DRAFT_726004 [Crucibulum laeve]